MCQLVAKAAAYITPNVQRKAFKQTGISLATDGSEDAKELSRSLKDLLGKHNLDLVPKKEDLTTAFFAPTEIKNPPSMTNIFKVLCADAGKSKKVEEFDKEPKIFAMKKSNK